MPSPYAAKPALDDPEEPQMLVCFPAPAILAHMKFTNLSRRIRSLVIRPAAEGYLNISQTRVEGIRGTFSDITSDGGYETAVEELSACMFPDVTTMNVSQSPAELETRTSLFPEKIMNQSKKIRCSKREPTTAECVTCDSHSRHSTDGSSTDLPKCATGGTLDNSQRHATRAMSDSRRYSTGEASSSQATSTSDPRRHSTCAVTSPTRRYSTGGSQYLGLSDSKTSNGPAFTSSRKAVVNPVSSMRSLLNPSTSMRTFLGLMCAEETPPVSTSDSKILPGASKSKRCSSEVLLRPRLKRILTPESPDWSAVPPGPEIDPPDDPDDYSNSNISWSSPLEDDHPVDVDSPKQKEEDLSASGHSTAAASPIDHFVIYVGSERKRFVISSQVVTHELFKKLLVSDNYKVEERDGKITIVLLCDTDYFQRLLFFVDQRKTYDEHRIRLSSASSKHYGVLAHESAIIVASASG